MACTSFADCVGDPLKDNGLGAAETFKNLSSAAIFSINVTIFFVYLALIISVVWFLFKGIYSIINADSSESFEKLRGAITNSVFAAVGIVLIFSARFFFVAALSLIGVPDAENVFTESVIYTIFTP